jgi:hypothetical protein
MTGGIVELSAPLDAFGHFVLHRIVVQRPRPRFVAPNILVVDAVVRVAGNQFQRVWQIFRIFTSFITILPNAKKKRFYQFTNCCGTLLFHSLCNIN